jgi:hypothetical protein
VIRERVDSAKLAGASKKMTISLDQVFSERYITDNSYVGWTMQLDCSDALQFLRNFYANWPELVVTIGL